MASAARLSPTANLLRKSRLFALPQALTPVEAPTSRPYAESDTATRPHPIRASIVTPASSLARGDWGLKRPLPAKSTSQKSSRPVVRINELDTFEHVTDFESASDHTVTLEKFQELHMPVSLPAKVHFSSNMVTKHHSVFDQDVDNTEASENIDQPDLKKIQKQQPQLVSKLRERFLEKRVAEIRNQAQDKGEDLENLPAPTEDDFQTYLKTLRADPFALGPVVYELLDLPATAPVPNERMPKKYYQSPPSKMASPEYVTSGPPITHPSAGLSYARSHASIYNHPQYGPQAHPRPVEARILRPRGRVRGKSGKPILGVGGIAVEDTSTIAFSEQGGPAGLSAFDPSIPGGARYHVTPIRAFVGSTGRISLITSRATTNAKAPYGIKDHKATNTRSSQRYTSFDLRGNDRRVPRLDRARTFSKPATGFEQPEQSTEDVAKNLLRTIKSQ
ncbi:hypothetical protein BDW72DRAFT_62065 [Aspergillus terricola var. indicus]